MPQLWDLNSLLKRKLWVVSGKGGVGKTTLAAALGLLASAHGLRTLLVETHGLTHLGDLLNKGAVGYEPKSVHPHLHLMQITPEAAFEEYVLQQIKFRMVYNAVFNNRYVRHFIEAAPGLNELLTIGKIWALVEGKYSSSKSQPYDLVIVDAPSTGHGLSLLTVPQIVVDAVRLGPLKTKSEEILALLQDPSKTLFWLATLPEEMPVNEATEMVAKLESTVRIELGPILINSVWPRIFEEQAFKELKKVGKKSPLLEVYCKRLEQSLHYIDKLKSQLPGYQFLELPLVYQTNIPLKIAETLKAQIQKDLSQGRENA